MLILTVVLLLLIISAVIYVFLIMPRVADAADMDLQCADYAHRGLHSSTIPENSLGAFTEAKENGYGITLDVRLSADGKVFVFYDEDLRRMCGVNKKFSSLKAKDIKLLRLKGTTQEIPLLTEVLTLVDGTVPILIEIKHCKDEFKLCRRLCEIMDTYGGAFGVQSFSPKVLQYFKKYRPRFARGQLVTKTPSNKQKKSNSNLANPFVRFALTHMLTNVISRPDFISIDGKLMREPAFLITTRVFRSKGFVWTVKTQKQYALCRKQGLYTIFENIKPQ